METLRRRLASYTVTRSHLICCAGIVALLVWLAWQRSAITSAQTLRDEFASQVKIQRAELAHLTEAVTRYPDKEASAASLEIALPDSNSIAELLVELSGRARAAGLSVRQLRRKPDKAEGEYSEISFTLTARGAYDALAGFLSGIAAMERIVDVVGLKIVALPRTSSGSDVEVTCDMRSYRIIAAASASPEVDG